MTQLFCRTRIWMWVTTSRPPFFCCSKDLHSTFLGDMPDFSVITMVLRACASGGWMGTDLGFLEHKHHHLRFKTSRDVEGIAAHPCQFTDKPWVTSPCPFSVCFPPGTEAAYFPCPLPAPEEPSLLCRHSDPAEQTLPSLPLSPTPGHLPAGPLHGSVQHHHLQAAVYCGCLLPPAGE